ncbi:YheU family protein [Geomesophilobacter sediminis]|nr:YheU family protein [Geomesophilobacter sediminis]
MNENNDVTIEYDRQDGQFEEGVIVPHDRISPDTLRKMVEEFVTRDWSELADAGSTLDGKIEQVLQQLKDGRAKVVFDLTTETCNIIPGDSRGALPGN